MTGKRKRGVKQLNANGKRDTTLESWYIIARQNLADRRRAKNKSKGLPSNHNVQYTKEEDSALLKGIQLYGRDVDRLSHLIPTRTRVSIQGRMNWLKKNVLNERVTLNYKVRKALLDDYKAPYKWQSSDYDALIEVCRREGGKVEKVAKHFPQWSVHTVANKIKQLRQKQRESEPQD